MHEIFFKCICKLKLRIPVPIYSSVQLTTNVQLNKILSYIFFEMFCNILNCWFLGNFSSDFHFLKNHSNLEQISFPKLSLKLKLDEKWPRNQRSKSSIKSRLTSMTGMTAMGAMTGMTATTRIINFLYLFYLTWWFFTNIFKLKYILILSWNNFCYKII